MPELLLLSNSTAPGRSFLEHVLAEIQAVAGGRDRLLFIPFASHDPDGYTRTIAAALQPVGIEVDSLHEAADPAAALRSAQLVFTGGGNTFRLLAAMTALGLLDPLRQAVRDGLPYLGASAGSNLACPSIRTTNDMPIVEVASLTALGLIPFQLNPHYLDPDPHSTHQGETRAERIGEFLEVNDVPVLGLREGSWLRVSGPRAVHGGARPSRLFRRGAEPTEVPPGTDLSWLLDAGPRFDVS